MCGSGIENFNALLTTITHRTENTTNSYDRNSKFFLYIKSWCHNSKGAAAKLVKEGFKELTLFDVEKKKYVCPEKWTDLEETEHVEELADAWFHKTVPQVFVNNSSTWSFLPGGNASVQTVTVGDTTILELLCDGEQQLKF